MTEHITAEDTVFLNSIGIDYAAPAEHWELPVAPPFADQVYDQEADPVFPVNNPTRGAWWALAGYVGVALAGGVGGFELLAWIVRWRTT